MSGSNNAGGINSPNSLNVKVVLLGSQSVGKTSILSRADGTGFIEEVAPTIGASFSMTKIYVDGCSIYLQIWDTAGQERFRAMAPLYYRNANAAFIVYDITDRHSFNHARSWVKELQNNVEDDHITLCVLGNKLDLTRKRQVSVAEGEIFADSIGASFFETSARDNTGLESAFLAVSKKLLEQADRIRSKRKAEGAASALYLQAASGSQEQQRKASGRKCCF